MISSASVLSCGQKRDVIESRYRDMHTKESLIESYQLIPNDGMRTAWEYGVDKNSLDSDTMMFNKNILQRIDIVIKLPNDSS